MIPPAGRPRGDRPPLPTGGTYNDVQRNPDVQPVKLPIGPGQPLFPVPATVPTKRQRRTGLVAVQKEVTPHEEAAFATIETEMGGRHKLVSTLSSAQLPANIEKVLGMIADPQHDHTSLAKICALGDLSLSKLIAVFRSATLTRGQLVAITRVAEKLPDVAASVMDDAVAGWRTCITCAGARIIEVMAVPPAESREELGTEPIPTNIPCPSCDGRGVTYFQPDHQVQKTALTLGGLLEKGSGSAAGGVTLIGKQVINAGTDSASYDALVGALDRAVYGEGRSRGAADAAEPPIEGELA